MTPIDAYEFLCKKRFEADLVVDVYNVMTLSANIPSGPGKLSMVVDSEVLANMQESVNDLMEAVIEATLPYEICPRCTDDSCHECVKCPHCGRQISAYARSVGTEDCLNMHEWWCVGEIFDLSKKLPTKRGQMQPGEAF